MTVMRTTLALVLFAALGCGTGTDGKPVAPPTTPEPVPQRPEAPTGLRLTDRGQDFIVWEWDPVEGVTGYEGHAFPRGTPGPDRPPHEFWTEPFYRAEGLEPGIVMGFFVRAVRETAGGRVVGDWSHAGGITLSADTPLAACTNQRQRALEFELDPPLVREWEQDRPFRVWVDQEAIRRGGLELGHADFLEEQTLEPLREVARRIEARLGYSIFDPYDLLPSEPSAGPPSIKVRRIYHLAPKAPPWSADCAPATHAPMSALTRLAIVQYNDHFFDPAITCRGFVNNREGKTIVHELAHIFGMKHAASAGDVSSRRRGGVFMSEALTGSFFFDRADILPEDIDNIGCMFPHPDFPREPF